jgi:hypothetical protein
MANEATNDDENLPAGLLAALGVGCLTLIGEQLAAYAKEVRDGLIVDGEQRERELARLDRARELLSDLIADTSGEEATTDEVRTYLRLIAEEDLDKNTDHLRWLEANPSEEDCDLQRAESERATELARRALVALATQGADT